MEIQSRGSLDDPPCLPRSTPLGAGGVLGPAVRVGCVRVPGFVVLLRMVGFGQARRLPEGKATETIYSLIRDGKHEACVEMLTSTLQDDPTSRPALSILGHCHYHLGDFDLAVEMYQRLGVLRPEDESVKLYHAQSLFKSGQRQESRAVASTITSGGALATQVARLLAHVAFEENELATCRAFLDKCPSDDMDVVVDMACVSLRDGKHEEALTRFAEARAALGYQPDVAYNEALCHYRAKQFGKCLSSLGEIIEKGVREHPELLVGAVTEGEEVRSVGNTPALRQTQLVEAFNLKAAVEFGMGNSFEAKEALTDMPPRSEEELDPVTLHNVALINMDTDPVDGFHKLNFLLSETETVQAPPETFANLLLLYVSPAHGFHDLAADVMAEHPGLVAKHLTSDAYEYLDACVTQRTDKELATRKFDAAATKRGDELGKLSRAISDARLRRDNAKVQRLLAEYDDLLEAFIPCLMAQAKVFWDKEQYATVEKILKTYLETCGSHETFHLNVAHVYFMQSLRTTVRDKFAEAIDYYEPVVLASAEKGSILSCTAPVLANLCVAYIMTSRNEDAESVMRRIEKEELSVSKTDPSRPKSFHLCIVNLVIGTLYCAKGNYEFGISRVIKSLEPFDEKLVVDTWFYAKRCFLSLAEGLAKRVVAAKDETVLEIFNFLEEAEKYGKDTVTTSETDNSEKRTIASEARALRRMFLKLREV